MLKLYAIVKVIRKRRPDNDYNNWGVNRRPPAIGDIGTVVEVLHAPNLHTRYVVESVSSDGTTIWLSDLEPSEVALVPENDTARNHLIYIRVKWLHHDPSEPTDFYYEIQEDDWAIRGIEVFADGSIQNVGHGLKEATIPTLEEINAMSDFEGMEISKDEFEVMWRKLTEDNN
jgi:Domain of unknown function (DUF6881)